MKCIIVIILLSLYPVLNYAQSQNELNQTAYKTYLKADLRLTKNYRKILKEYKNDTVFIRNLKNAQRIWYRLRDAEMKAKYPERAGGLEGSSAPMCWNWYKAELTRERIKQLNMWLLGTPEGDVCVGSEKVRQ
jgi:uncharacterized protein YecT (DUF1311 family)